MTNLNWPPDLDGIKIDKQSIFGRVRGTDIWVELDRLKKNGEGANFSQEINALILAWAQMLQR